MKSSFNSPVFSLIFAYFYLSTVLNAGCTVIITVSTSKCCTNGQLNVKYEQKQTHHSTFSSKMDDYELKVEDEK